MQTAPETAEQEEREYLGPAVVNGELRFTSVSQLQLLLPDPDPTKDASCERKWWLRYVLGHKEPKTKSQIRGDEGHARLARYLKTGQNVLDPLEMLGLAFLPKPGTVLAEAPIREGELTADGVRVVGSLDILARGYVRDHKFSSDVAQYGSTPEQLTDPKTKHGLQMTAYAAVAGERGGTEQVSVGHFYFQTKKKAARPVETTIGTRDARLKWHSVADPIARRLRELARAKTLDEVKPNWTACDQFRGCAFKEICLRHAAGIHPLPAKAAQPGAPPMGFMSRLASQSSATAAVQVQAAPPPQNVAPPAPLPVPPAAPRKIVIHDSDPDLPKPAAAAPAPVTLPAKHATQGMYYTLPSGQVGVFICGTNHGQSFMPITGGAPVLLAETALVTPFTAVAAPTQAPAPMPVAELPAVLPPDAPPSNPALAARDPEPAPAPAEEKTRKRRTKAEIEADKLAEAQALLQKTGALPIAPPTAVVSAPHVAPPTAVVSAPPVAPAQSAPSALRVFVDAVPNAETKPLSEYIADAKRTIEAKANVIDMRVAPKDSPLGYGAWKGVLAAYVRESPPAPGSYYVSGASEIAQVVIEALEGICGPGNFVRGVR